MKKVILISFLITAFAFSGRAQDNPTVELSVNVDTLYVGNSFKLKLIANNVNGTFESPILDDCLIQGPMTSSQFQSINGVSQSQITSSYIIKPERTGIFQIPGIKFIANDQTYQTLPTQLVVVENPNGIVQEIQDENLNFGFPSMDSFFKNKPAPSPEPEPSLKNRKRRKF